MESEDILIHVDNRSGSDNHDGIHQPVETADKAFSLLPPSWHGSAEIIFAVTDIPYPIRKSAVYFGTPIGPDASSLVIRGGYLRDGDFGEVTATAVSGGDEVATDLNMRADQLIGKVLTRLSRLSPEGSPVGTAISIRGNSPGPNSRIFLQRTMGRIAAGDTFAVQRPAVTLAPDPPPHYPSPAEAGQALNLTSHDGRSPNLKLVGITFAPFEGRGLNLLNVRAQCDTCEFLFKRTSDRDPKSTIFYLHTDARIQGGVEGDPERASAGAYIHSDHAANIVWAVRGGVLGGHLTFDKITVRASQGGVFVPKSLEAREAPIQILAGGSAIAEPQKEGNVVVGGWGTAFNKARIRNVAGDGLRLFNGGSMNSPGSPTHLDIFGCSGDGIRLDMDSTASFGLPGGPAGLVTTGGNNGGFGMNVRNASRALVGSDAATASVPGRSGPTPLRGTYGEVALDGRLNPLGVLVDGERHNWSDVPPSGLSRGGSLVRPNV